MKYTIFNMKGFEEYTSWLKEDKSKYEKINNLITSIQRDGPLNGIGKPEALKGNYKGNYSRRIDDKNRLIYQYQKNEKTGDVNTVIIGCKEHYKGQTQKEKLVSMLSITN
ncbi:MAG: Txe/YoeB family addiction module toxin [Treponema sp.]|nr:Txe/YoeB family addiction module toxin [Treponema sp.]